MRTTGEQDLERGPSPVARPGTGVPPLLAAAVLLARTALCVAITLWLAALAPALFGLTVSTVMSDSMAPAIVAGDVVAVRPIATAQLRTGQVLLVDDPDRPGRLRLHRLAAKHDGALVLRGDANATPDSSVVMPQHVRGVAILRVPLAGLPDLWFRTGAVPPLAVFAVVLAGLGLLACTDIRPPPGDPPSTRRRVPLARLLLPRRRRAVGVRALVLVAALSTAVMASATAGQGGAVFSGIVTTSANTIGANTLFTNCPNRPAGLPTPSLYYAYTANSGTTEKDLAGSNTGSVANATRTAGYCDGSAASPYLTLTDSTQTSVVTTSTKLNPPSVAFSISLWMNPSNAGTGILADFTNSLGQGSQTTNDRQMYYKTDGTLAFGALFGSGGQNGTPATCSTTAPASGTWHHVVGTATSAGVLTLYVDGAQACTVTGTGGYSSGGAAAGGFWSFGAENPKNATAWGESTTNPGFVGGFDETTVYTRDLTANEVTNLYAAGH